MAIGLDILRLLSQFCAFHQRAFCLDWTRELKKLYCKFTSLEMTSRSNQSDRAQGHVALQTRHGPLYKVAVRLLSKLCQELVCRQLRTNLGVLQEFRGPPLRAVPDAPGKSECKQKARSSAIPMTCEVAVQTGVDEAQQSQDLSSFDLSSLDRSDATDRDSGAEPSSSSGRSSTQCRSAIPSSSGFNSPPSSHSSGAD